MQMNFDGHFIAPICMLCAVGQRVVCAWLLPEALVQRSNIAHNVLACLLSVWPNTKLNRYG